MEAIRPLLVFGTRPETIKMAPVIRECQFRVSIDPILCSQGQRREMLIPLLEYFDVGSDVQLDSMRPSQSLSGLTSRCLGGLSSTTQSHEPGCVVARGDTATVMVASITAFYRRLPFVHVEAGSTAHGINSPWPEEFSRRVASLTASIHCAPVEQSSQDLLAEGIREESIHVAGNTVVDALLWMIDRERRNSDKWERKYEVLGGRRMVLITGHRRENFGSGFESICHVTRELFQASSDVEVIYFVYLNPKVREPLFRLLGDAPDIQVTEPAPCPEFAWLMDRSILIVTDSIGVQEEAPSLRKPVVVMRETTERQGAVGAGAVRLVGANGDAVFQAASKMLLGPHTYAKCQLDYNPYGDGRPATRISELIRSQAWSISAAAA